MIRTGSLVSWLFVFVPLLVGFGLILDAYGSGVADGDERCRGKLDVWRRST